MASVQDADDDPSCCELASTIDRCRYPLSRSLIGPDVDFPLSGQGGNVGHILAIAGELGALLSRFAGKEHLRPCIGAIHRKHVDLDLILANALIEAGDFVFGRMTMQCESSAVSGPRIDMHLPAEGRQLLW